MENRIAEKYIEWIDTLRGLQVYIMSCKVDNDNLLRDRDRKAEVNAAMLQILSEL